MKKLTMSFFIFSLLVSFGAMASGITPIKGANILCAQEGGAILINTNDQRLWQSDTAKDKEGLEIDIEQFRQARCPNCFEIQGRLPGMENTQSIIYTVKGDSANLKKATLKVTFQDSGDSEEIAEMKCKIK